MKYIISTFVAAIIAFFIWAQYGKEEPVRIMALSNGTHPGILLKDTGGELTNYCLAEGHSLCTVYIKVKNGFISEVDSNNRKTIWANALSPAKLTNNGVARIVTADGNRFLVMLGGNERSSHRFNQSFD